MFERLKQNGNVFTVDTLESDSNAFGTVHGGFYPILVDICTKLLLSSRGYSGSSVQSSTQYLRATPIGQRLEIKVQMELKDQFCHCWTLISNNRGICTRTSHTLHLSPLLPTKLFQLHQGQDSLGQWFVRSMTFDSKDLVYFDPDPSMHDGHHVFPCLMPLLVDMVTSVVLSMYHKSVGVSVHINVQYLKPCPAKRLRIRTVCLKDILSFTRCIIETEDNQVVCIASHTKTNMSNL